MTLRFNLSLLAALMLSAGVVSTDDHANLPNVWKLNEGGQSCPVSHTEALTANHIGQHSPLVWSYPGSARGGTVTRVWWDERFDIAMLKVVDGDEFSRFYPLAEGAPSVGDKVWVQGYDRSKGFTVNWVEAKVLHVFAGQITYDKSPGPGSSGSCVLNAEGEIVAINSGGFQRHPGQDSGVGVLVVGHWKPIDNRWRKTVKAN